MSLFVFLFLFSLIVFQITSKYRKPTSLAVLRPSLEAVEKGEFMVTKKNLKVVKEFENMKDTAELNALSKVSLTRPLTTLEFIRMKVLASKVGIL